MAMLSMDSEELRNTHPIDIYRTIDAAYGEEPWIDWETDTLLTTVLAGSMEDAYPEALDKLLSVQATAANSNLAVTESLAFEKIVNSFCNNFCVLDAQQPPEIEEIIYAVKQIQEIICAVHEVETTDIEFTGEIPGYVAAVAKYRDWAILPHPLGFAQDFLLSLLGMPTGSEKWQANEALITAAREAIESLGDRAEDLTDLSVLDKITGDGFTNTFVSRVVGALLFDPTQS